MGCPLNHGSVRIVPTFKVENRCYLESQSSQLCKDVNSFMRQDRVPHNSDEPPWGMLALQPWKNALRRKKAALL